MAIQCGPKGITVLIRSTNMHVFAVLQMNVVALACLLVSRKTLQLLH